MKMALLALLIAAIVSPAFAADDWNGTWAGNWDKGGSDGVQIIMAGNTAVGLYWHGDYIPDELQSSVSGSTLTISWGPNTSNAFSIILTRESATTAHVMLHQPGRGLMEFSVRRDP